MANAKNVFGKKLQLCCGNSGFTREGFCYVPVSDLGNHSVCAIMHQEFLAFSARKGHDLTTPHPELQFPGLKPGDRWCLCASLWLEAYKNNVAPRINLDATHSKVLEVVPLEILKIYSSTPA